MISTRAHVILLAHKSVSDGWVVFANIVLHIVMDLQIWCRKLFWESIVRNQRFANPHSATLGGAKRGIALFSFVVV